MVVVIDGVVLLTDQLVGLLSAFSNRAAHLRILTLQLSAGKVLHNASPERVTQHIGGGTQAVSKERQESGYKVKLYREGLFYACCKTSVIPKFINVPLNSLSTL